MSKVIWFLALLFVCITCMGTSCVRSVYSIRVVPLKECPNVAFKTASVYDSEEWSIGEGKTHFRCPVLKSYILHSNKRDRVEGMSEAFFSAGIVRSGNRCEWRSVVEVFCGQSQSLEECKSEIPYQKQKVAMDQITSELHHAIGNVMTSNHPDLRRKLDQQAKSANNLIIEDLKALAPYCN
ncbi:MAG: hypothetical protein AABZ55_03155 [Bdellovibrionota bacterium]